MPRRRGAGTVTRMRWVVLVAVLGIGLVLLRQHQQEADGGGLPANVQATRFPPEFRSILDASSDPVAVLGSRGALPGLGAIRRLIGADKPETPEIRPFADIGPRRQVLAVRRDIRRNLQALNRAHGSVERARRALRDVYSAPVLAALGPDGRRVFAERIPAPPQASQRIPVPASAGASSPRPPAPPQAASRPP